MSANPSPNAPAARGQTSHLQRSEDAKARFRLSFNRRARGIRTRLVARILLWSLTVGAALATVTALLLWQLGAASWRPVAWVTLAIALSAGAFASQRRRWSDRAVALYLDARLASRELIATALDLAAQQPDERATRQAVRAPVARAFVLEQAATALDAERARLAPRAFCRWHLAAPLAAAATVFIGTLEPPTRAHAAPPPVGVAKVTSKDVPGLREMEALASVAAGDPAQARRLRDISRRARELREKLVHGMERREALNALGKLRDDVAAERLSLNGRSERPGLEAAILELRKHPHLSAAARALGNGDLTAFDDAMRELANREEGESRKAAREALEEAAKSARERGHERLGRLFDEQRKRLGPDGASARSLRELAEALQQELGNEELGEDVLDALKGVEATGSEEARRRLAEALGKALGHLSEEERARLAQRLARRLAERGPRAVEPLTAERLEALARLLDDPEKLKELEEWLRELARARGDEIMERERSLDDAERGAADAQRQLSGVVPVPDPSGPSASSGAPGPSRDGTGSPANGPSSTRERKPGAHDGETNAVDAPELRAKATTAIDPSLPLRVAAEGRAAPLVGQTANQGGTAELGRVGPVEVGAVERSEVPGEYREHVGRYFSP
jgi:hypothetical protein